MCSRKSGSQQTLRWSEVDSNPRSHLGIIVSRSLLSSRPVPLWESGNHHFANGEPKVRIHLPPPASQLRTWLPRSGCLTVLVPADRADDALRQSSASSTRQKSRAAVWTGLSTGEKVRGPSL